MVKPSLQITFLLQDFDQYYTKTVDYIARQLGCRFITEKKHRVITGRGYARTNNDYSIFVYNINDIKALVKCVAKHSGIICFIQYGSMQRVYGYTK